MKDFTIGADCEVMLEKNGRLVSAVGILPDAETGIPLPHGKIFYDNVLAEFTVSPSKTKKTFVKNITENLEAAKKLFKKKGLDVRIVASAHYPKEELQSDVAKQFGCSPDYDAYALIMNEPSTSAAETTLRSAGAHVHFAHPVFENPYKIVEMIKIMDLLLGVPSIIKDNNEAAKERKQLYGKAGAHRPKEYPGGEYRPLSNFWIASEENISWVFDTTVRALELVLKDKTIENMGVNPKDIQRCINIGDVELALELSKMI